jgi:predicted kinase
VTQLVIFIGLQGAGKTTFYAERFRELGRIGL